MLCGSADPQVLAQHVPTMERLDADAVTLGGVETLCALWEISASDLEARLPPALHPTVPPVVTWMIQRFPTSPWGPFQMAQTRIECRSGLRPRGFLVSGVIDNSEAQRALAAGWGYSLAVGAVDLRRSYDKIRGVVSRQASLILAVTLRDPGPLRASDVQYVANMNLAHTPRGLRLVQVDPDYEIERAERGSPDVDVFDGEAWGDEGIEPSYPVSGSFTVSQITLPKLRYLCRPDELAFHGTERLGETAETPSTRQS